MCHSPKSPLGTNCPKHTSVCTVDSLQYRPQLNTPGPVFRQASVQDFSPATCGLRPSTSTHLYKSEGPAGTGQKSVVCPSPGRWDLATPMVAEAVVRMISRATRSGSRHNSQVYFLLDQGGAEDIAGQLDLGRDQMPSPGAPPSRPIHHCPSPTKQHRLQTGGGEHQLSTPGDYRPPLEIGPKYTLPH